MLLGITQIQSNKNSATVFQLHYTDFWSFSVCKVLKWIGQHIQQTVHTSFAKCAKIVSMKNMFKHTELNYINKIAAIAVRPWK